MTARQQKCPLLPQAKAESSAGKNKMKKSQVSFEFIIIFAIVLFIFAALIGFFPRNIENTETAKELAKKFSMEIEAKVITASLAKSDFTSKIDLPEKILDRSVSFEIFGSPDDILLIKDRNSGEILSKAFLPKMDSVGTAKPDGTKLKIRNDQLGLALIKE